MGLSSNNLTVWLGRIQILQIDTWNSVYPGYQVYLGIRRKANLACPPFQLMGICIEAGTNSTAYGLEVEGEWRILIMRWVLKFINLEGAVLWRGTEAIS